MAAKSITTENGRPYKLNAGLVGTQTLHDVAAALLDLNIARKNLSIYPSTHEQTKRSAVRACRKMRALLSVNCPLTVTVMQGTLAIGCKPLEDKGGAFKALAAVFKQRGIAAVTFTHLFQDCELVGFLKLLTLDPRQFVRHGALEDIIAQAGLKNIVPHVMDYSKLHITEKEWIAPAASEHQPVSAWELFVSHLLVEAPPDGVVGPAQMAELLNGEQLDARAAVGHFKAAIADYLGRSSGDDTAGGRRTHDLDLLHRLVESLKPALQEQFLAVTFDACAETGVGRTTAELIGGMDSALVMRMIRRANDEGKQISPSLLAFVKKMGAGSISAPGTIPAGAATADHAALQALFDRENYESFVDASYDRMLKKLSDEAGRDLSEELDALKRETEADLDEPRLTARTARVLTSLMAASGDSEAYRDWARQLTFMLDDLMINGAYEALIDILHSVQKETEHQEDRERVKIANLVLDHFQSAAFLANAVISINKPLDRLDGHALAFLELLGEAVLIEVIDALAGAERLEADSALLKLLQRTRLQSTRLVLERLRDARPWYVCRMLALLRHFAQGERIEGVKQLLDHENEDVRMEALSTLLHFDNPWGGLHLRDMLTAPWSPQTMRAMQLAGQYRIREVVPLLIGYLSRPGPVRADIGRREAALRTLAKIGDPQCLPILTKIAKRRWSLSKKHLTYLKRVLFESLDGYPYDSVKSLVHLGLKQKDPSIPAVCRRLLKKHHGVSQADDHHD